MKKFKTLQEMFQDGNRWVKGKIRKVDYHNISIAWCLEGAVQEVYTDNKIIQIKDKIKEYLVTKGFVGIVSFNDDDRTTIEDIRTCAKALNI